MTHGDLQIHDHDVFSEYVVSTPEGTVVVVVELGGGVHVGVCGVVAASKTTIRELERHSSRTVTVRR